MDTLDLPSPVVDWLFKVLQPAYFDARAAFHDIASTISTHKSLRPRTRVFTDTYGRSQLLLCLYGKIGAEHPLPVLIWVPTEYPIVAPYVYVDFDSLQGSNNMIGDSVDANGSIYLPILTRWNPEQCNLLQVVVELEQVADDFFPISAPVSSPSSPPIPPREFTNTPKVPELPPKPPKSPLAGIGHVVHDMSRVNINSEIPLLPPRPVYALQNSVSPLSESLTGGSSFSSSKVPAPVTPADTGNTDGEASAKITLAQQPDLMDLSSEVAQDPLHTKMLQDLQDALNKLSASDQQEVHDTLESRMNAIKVATEQFQTIYQHELTALDHLEHQIDGSTKTILEEIDQTSKQLQTARKYIQDYGPGIDLHSIVSTNIAGLDQLYQLLAKDHAISDTIHTMGKMLGADAINLEVFIKKVRSLSREQFFVRVHINKIISIVN